MRRSYGLLIVQSAQELVHYSIFFVYGKGFLITEPLVFLFKKES